MAGNKLSHGVFFSLSHFPPAPANNPPFSRPPRRTAVCTDLMSPLFLCKIKNTNGEKKTKTTKHTKRFTSQSKRWRRTHRQNAHYILLLLYYYYYYCMVFGPPRETKETVSDQSIYVAGICSRSYW